MYGKPKEERDKVSKEIEKDAIAIEMNSKAINGKSIWDLLLIDCCMYGKPKEERDKVSKEIEKDAITIEMNSKAIEGKFLWD